MIKNASRISKTASSKSRIHFKSTVGLEIHAQIASKTKLFSNAECHFAAPINSSVNLLDASIPGTLPILNKRCVEVAALTSLTLNCNVNSTSHFDRKHYFYADLPAGYQITQQRSPIANGGKLDFMVFTPGIHAMPYRKTCRLKQIQLEQDSGKSLHDELGRRSLIDLNRAGTALMEFVFEPDLSDGEEAAGLVKELILILQRLKACSCKMEEGALRIDANVSVSDSNVLGIRTEIKNIGSVRGVANAVSYEINRQIDLIERGGYVINETRSWDPILKKTVAMRDKESKQDYRFMPEPNLLPLRIEFNLGDHPNHNCIDLTHLKELVPQLPETSRELLKTRFGFSDVYAIVLVGQPKLYDLFNAVINESPGRDSKLLWNILTVQLLNIIYNNEMDVENCELQPEIVGEIIDMLDEKKIDLATAKTILEMIVKGEKATPRFIVEKNGWTLISDVEKIDYICRQLIEKHPDAVKKFKKGRTKALQVMINDVISFSSEKINLSLISKRLKEILQ